MKRRSISDIPWVKAILVLAGIFNIIWGIITVFFQSFYFNLIDLEAMQYSSLWVSSGIMAFVMGIGYLIAATNAMRFWPIVFMGFLTKVFMPMGILSGYLNGEVAGDVFRVALTNHLIWWLPFGAILYRVYNQAYRDDLDMIDFATDDYEMIVNSYETNQGNTLQEVSEEHPTMLVFLRHFGCTFCREALQTISQEIDSIEAKGTKVVLVHMVDTDEATEQLETFNLQHLEHISDPESLLYKGFKLRRGGFGELFGPKVIFRGLYAGWIKKLGLGSPMGDIFQMPGIFLIYHGEVKKQYYHKSAADIPPYLELADCTNC